MLGRACCCTCILRAKKVSFWADDASSWDLEYSLLPLKPSLDNELDDEDPCCATQLECQMLTSLTKHECRYVGLPCA